MEGRWVLNLKGCHGGYEREGVELLTVVLVVFGDFDEVHREPSWKTGKKECVSRTH